MASMTSPAVPVTSPAANTPSREVRPNSSSTRMVPSSPLSTPLSAASADIVHRHGGAPAAFGGPAEVAALKPQTTHLSVRGLNGDGYGKVQYPDAFLLRLIYFFVGGGHLGAGAPVDEVYFLRAAPKRAPRGVQGRVAAAHHGHTPARARFLAAVHTPQEINGGDDPIGVVSRNCQPGSLVGAERPA